MFLSTEQSKKILRNAKLEYRGVHENNGWGYSAYYMIDNTKVSFKVKSKNPRKATLVKLLIVELQRRFQAVSLRLEVSWSGSMNEIAEYDPYSVLDLAKKYLVNQSIYFDNKKRA